MREFSTADKLQQKEVQRSSKKFKRSSKKELQIQGRTSNLKLCILQHIYSGIQPATISKLECISESALQYHLNELKHAGAISKIGYGTWEVSATAIFDLKRSTKEVQITSNKYKTSTKQVQKKKYKFKVVYRDEFKIQDRGQTFWETTSNSRPPPAYVTPPKKQQHQFDVVYTEAVKVRSSGITNPTPARYETNNLPIPLNETKAGRSDNENRLRCLGSIRYSIFRARKNIKFTPCR